MLALFYVGVSAQQPLRVSLPNAPDTVKFMVRGDNLYGSQKPADLVAKFERPYKPLLDSGVQFYASLGNHDSQTSRFYRPWHMGGERYYTYARKNVRFFVLDSNKLDRTQLTWLIGQLKGATEDWKVAYFHHPLYSSGGRH